MHGWEQIAYGPLPRGGAKPGPADRSLVSLLRRAMGPGRDARVLDHLLGCTGPWLPRPVCLTRQPFVAAFAAPGPPVAGMFHGTGRC